ncbi:hypothetical protein CH253_18780 [Rhodococcus sp. 06-156-3C]|nr:hypothetical protein CH248_27980 [Rhodococcus sp. 06-156-4a]OZD17973.1 hypothetical protein CH253_18780 [Rhodococcus sp. 06-156-3C]OZD20697.1 hypothetical protein CH280_03935 [Rhodococcus sp. 06-156-4C]OZD30584.1 hypothetical protein CH247_14795 [Rhodococcus sp. 06-156-3b]OZD32643.1 hypothetical protein CH284_20465 [Rhodococcus sp. 06-156-3]OZF64946.1 hypothetical protein CH290_10120 [Rhodococcus sp. 06-156-4]
MRGMAVSGVLARAVEHAVTDPVLRPVRWTLEMCRVATMNTCRSDVRIIRQGRRITLVEADLIQQNEVVATARALFLRGEPRAIGAEVWAPACRWSAPPTDLLPVTAGSRLYYDEVGGWTAEPPAHSAKRNVLWLSGFRIVDCDEPTPFQFAASTADVASVVGNWGNAGMQFINADVTLALARLPEGPGIGMAALDHVETDGITTSVVSVFDRTGTLGTAVVCAVANLDVTVDPAESAVR